MLLGPVFQAELLRTARRKRYYVLRVLYVSMLLFIFWLGYEKQFLGQTSASIKDSADFASGTFVVFAIVQLFAILLMIPALFGGAIADEKQRKTLHYLMASSLSSFEIVVDKVLGRMPHVAVFLAMGLPVVCLLGLIGGVPPDFVFVAYVGTASTATMALAITVLLSTISRKVRQAVLISYVLILAWQFAPTVLKETGPPFFPEFYGWIEQANEWIGATTPLFVYARTLMRVGRIGPIMAGSLAGFPEQFAWMVGLQLGSSALMVLIAVWRLRPAFRRHEATRPRRKWFGERKKVRTRKRWWDRPPCGNDAVLWKERFFARSDLFTKLVILPATVFVSVILVLGSGIDESLMNAFGDIWRSGFGTSGGERLVDHLRVFTAWYVGIWLLAVAGASASCLTIEREEDTWISLISTPLSGWEIVRGKVLGAAWAQRGFLAVPLGLWSIGLLTGAVHPIAYLAALVMLGLMTWMVAAVGVDASLRASSTSRALASTMGKLFVLYGYPIFLVRGFLGGDIWNSYVSFLGLPPRLAVGPLASYNHVSGLWWEATRAGLGPVLFREGMIFGLVATSIYATIAALMTYRAVGRFDVWLDRPRIIASDHMPTLVREPRTVEPAIP